MSKKYFTEGTFLKDLHKAIKLNSKMMKEFNDIKPKDKAVWKAIQEGTKYDKSEPPAYIGYIYKNDVEDLYNTLMKY